MACILSWRFAALDLHEFVRYGHVLCVHVSVWVRTRTQNNVVRRFAIHRRAGLGEVV